MPVPETDQPLMLSVEQRKLLRRFARNRDLEPYDLLLLGDGSGNTHQQPAGWACISYDRPLKQAVVHAGGLTAGTTNLVELMPFVHALWFHTRQHRHEMVSSYKVSIVITSAGKIFTRLTQHIGRTDVGSNSSRARGDAATSA